MARDKNQPTKKPTKKGWPRLGRKRSAGTAKISDGVPSANVVGTVRLNQDGIIVLRDTDGHKIDPETIKGKKDYIVIERPDPRIGAEQIRRETKPRDDPKPKKSPELSGLRTANPAPRERQPAGTEPTAPKGKPAKKGWFK